MGPGAVGRGPVAVPLDLSVLREQIAGVIREPAASAAWSQEGKKILGKKMF
jgi:hypothetical protein